MRVIKFGLVLFMSMLCLSAQAGSYQGVVTSVFAYNGKIFIKVSNGGFDNPVTCTGTTDSLSLWIDPTTDYDKSQLSISLTAKTTGKIVWVAGYATCIDGPLGKSERMTAIDFKG